MPSLMTSDSIISTSNSDTESTKSEQQNNGI